MIPLFSSPISNETFLPVSYAFIDFALESFLVTQSKHNAADLLFPGALQ